MSCGSILTDCLWLYTQFLEVLSQAREHRRAQLFSEWDSDGEESEPDPQFELDGRLQGAQLKDPAWLAAAAPDFIAKVAAQAAPKAPAATEAAAEPPQQIFKLTLADSAFGDACATGLSFVVVGLGFDLFAHFSAPFLLTCCSLVLGIGLVPARAQSLECAAAEAAGAGATI